MFCSREKEREQPKTSVELGVQNETRVEWAGRSKQNQLSLKRRPGRSPHPLLYHTGGIWGSELEGTGEGGGNTDTCKPDAGSVSSRVRSSWGKEGTWPSWDPAVILTTRWQAQCPAWGQEPVCFPPTARSPFHFSPCTDKLHISMICCHGGTEKPSQMLPDQRALGWPHSHAHVDARAVWVSLSQRGIKSHRTVAAFWSLHSHFSLAKAPGGSQPAVLAGQTAPREAGRTRISLFRTCFNQQSDASWLLLYMPETILLHRVVSDIRQSEKARRTNLTWARAAIFRVRLRAQGLDSDLGEDFPLNSVGHSKQALPGAEEKRGWQNTSHGFLWLQLQAGVLHKYTAL